MSWGRVRRAFAPPSAATAAASEPARDPLLGDRIQTVLASGRRLTRTLDSETVFRTMVEEVNGALGGDGTTIHLLRDNGLVLVAWAGISDVTAARLPAIAASDPWFVDLVADRRPRATEDVRRSGRSGYERWTGDLAFAGELVVPLAHDDRIIGVLRCVSREPRRWDPADIAFIDALAAHASIAIHNAELFERTETRAAQLAVLQAASARINRARTVEAVGRAIVEETRRILDYHNGRVHLLEPPDVLAPIAFEGRVGAYRHVDLDVLRTRVGVGFTGWVAQTGSPLLVDDASADPRGTTIPGTDEVDESMVVVPMRTDDGVLGVITLSKLGLRQFDGEDLRLLTILADHAATALESARLMARAADLTRELQLLVEMGSELSGSLDPRQVATLTAQHLARALGTDRCIVSWWDRAGDRVATLGFYPPTAGASVEPEFEIQGYPETTRVLETQATVVIDVDDPEADRAEVELLRRDGNRMLAMLPLVAKGQSVGLVELVSNTRVEFDDAHLALARTMANEASMALENARLYEEARMLADRDPLTGFFNHRYLHERLGEEIIRAQRSRRPVSLLMLDLDDFKLVNDTFGHLFGDRVLVWVAERIKSTLRTTDVPARYGGDEFALILPETDADAARQASERILQAFAGHGFEAEGRGPLPVGLSIGVASSPADGRTPTTLIAAADRRLYRIKRSRGGGIETSDGPDEAATDRSSSAA